MAPVTLDTAAATMTSSIVLDVDLSRWDDSIVLLIGTDDSNSFPYDTELWLIGFVATSWMSLDMSHVVRPSESDPSHTRWRIDHIELVEYGDGVAAEFSSYGDGGPRGKIHCRSIDMEWVDRRVLDERFPGWWEPGSPLVRPGIRAVMDRTVAEISG